MTGPDEPAGNGAATEPEPAPTLTLRWVGPGAADFSITPSPNLQAAQLYAAAWLLDAYAREVRMGQAAAAAGPLARLVLPGLGQPAGAGRRS